MLALVVIRLDALGFTTRTIALIQTTDSLGLIAGSFIAYKVINRLRHIRAYTLFAVLFAICAVLFAFTPPPWGWLPVAFMMGASGFGLTVVIESWLQYFAPNQLRGRIMAIYLMIGYAASSAGLWAVDFFDPLSLAPLLFIAALMVLSPLPMTAARHHMPDISRPRHLSLLALYRASPLGTVATMVSGVVLGAQYSMAIIFALSRGEGFFGGGTYLAAFTICGMLMVYPIGRRSDATDRRLVLLVTFTGLSAAAIGLISLAETRWLLLIMVGVMGAISSAIYPQATSYVNDYLDQDQRVSANSSLMLAFSLGLLGGPLPATLAMGLLGPTGLYVFVAAIAGSAAVFTLWRMTRRPAAPARDDPYAAIATLPLEPPLARRNDDSP